MIKKKISQLLAIAMVVGVMGAATPSKDVHASEVNVTVTQSVDYDEATLEQLTMAVEEMKIAVTELESGSLDTDRILAFAVTALERVRPLEIAEGTTLYGNYRWVVDTYGEVLTKVEEVQAYVLEQLTYAVEEMRIAITELDNGSTDHERILTFAATALERVRPLVINEDSHLYGNYRWVVDTYGEVVNTIAQTPAPQQEVVEADYDEATLEQLTMAVEEMKIAVTELESGSLDTDRILAFAVTALERVRPLEIAEGTTLYGNYRWVVDTYGEVLTKVEEVQAYVLEQLTYAVEEMRIAITELDNGSTDHERILTFAATALERVRPLVINEDSHLYGNYRWVIDAYGEVVNTIAQTPSPLN